MRHFYQQFCTRTNNSSVFPYLLIPLKCDFRFFTQPVYIHVKLLSIQFNKQSKINNHICMLYDYNLKIFKRKFYMLGISYISILLYTQFFRFSNTPHYVPSIDTYNTIIMNIHDIIHFSCQLCLITLSIHS